MSNPELQARQYIGDGVYAGHDGYQVWIWTSDGIRESEKIALERSTLASLLDYACSLELAP